MNRYEYLTNEEVDTIYRWFKELDIKNPMYILPLIEKNPVFFLKTLVNNRSKSKAITALVFLSMVDKQDCKTMFLENFNKVVIDIRELVIFLEKVSRLRGHGKIIKKAVYSWFKIKPIKMIEIEFKNNLNSKWNNQDLLNEFHIKPWNEDISKLFKQVVEAQKALDKVSKK